MINLTEQAVIPCSVRLEKLEPKSGTLAQHVRTMAFIQIDCDVQLSPSQSRFGLDCAYHAASSAVDRTRSEKDEDCRRKAVIQPNARAMAFKEQENARSNPIRDANKAVE